MLYVRLVGYRINLWLRLTPRSKALMVLVLSPSVCAMCWYHVEALSTRRQNRTYSALSHSISHPDFGLPNQDDYKIVQCPMSSSQTSDNMR